MAPVCFRVVISFVRTVGSSGGVVPSLPGFPWTVPHCLATLLDRSVSLHSLAGNSAPSRKNARPQNIHNVLRCASRRRAVRVSTSWGSIDGSWSDAPVCWSAVRLPAASDGQHQLRRAANGYETNVEGADCRKLARAWDLGLDFF